MLNPRAANQRQGCKPRLLLFPASLRRDSYQLRLLTYLSELLGDHCEIDILRSSEVDLPLFNQDLESVAPILEGVKSIHGRFSLADGVIVSSPEYNGHASPYLKNTVDWVSRLERIDASYGDLNPFRQKPLLLCSASPGWTGGVLGLQDARSIFSYLGYLVVAGQICVSDADQWLHETTYRFEPGFATHVAGVLGEFLSLVERLHVSRRDSADSQSTKQRSYHHA